MKPEELLQMLREAGMDDEAIKALLNDALGALDGGAAAEGEPAAEPQEEDEEKKFNDFYGL